MHSISFANIPTQSRLSAKETTPHLAVNIENSVPEKAKGSSHTYSTARKKASNRPLRNTTREGGLSHRYQCQVHCQKESKSARYLSEKSLTDASHRPAATAAALPPELPPAERLSLSSNGLMTGPWTEYLFNELAGQVEVPLHGEQVTNGSPHSKFITVRFSNNFCPCSSKESHNRRIVRGGEFCPKLDRFGGRRVSGAPLSIREEQVVGMSEVHILSFTATVTPDNGPPGEACPGLTPCGRCTKALMRASRG